MKQKEAVLKIFDRLLGHYGPRKWWPARTSFEVIVGAILVQNVSWKNTKIAIDSLKKAGLLDPYRLASVNKRFLAGKIKSSRFYNQKAENLKTFCSHLTRNYGGSLKKMFKKDVPALREELLGLRGIGKETADSILLYAGNKLSFVSDAYTKRLLLRYGIFPGRTDIKYDEIRDFFTKHLPEDAGLYNEYHALIDHHCSRTCRTKPECDICPIKRISSTIFCRY